MIRIGVVGAGAWGSILIRNVAECDAARLAVVCDTNLAALERISRRYHDVHLVQNYDALLNTKGLDAVIVGTPPGRHFDQARGALRAGLHVLVEKPICTTSREALELCNLADQNDRVLMCGHIPLYSNLLQNVKQRIDAGELGKIRYIYMRRLNLGRVRQDIDALWNLAPHDIAAACYLLDAWPRSVNAHGWSYLQPQRNIADVCFFQMEFADGVAVSGHVSWLDPQKDRTIVVVGSEKMLVYDDIDHSKHIQIFDKGVDVEFYASVKSFSEYAMRIRSGDLNIPNAQPVEPLAVEIAHFVECIETGDTPRTDGRQGLRLVRVLEGMSRSMTRKGANIEIDCTGESDNAVASPTTGTKDVEESSKCPVSRSMI